MISYRVAKQDDYIDGNVYVVSCMCGHPDCDLILEFGIDVDFPEIILTISKDLDLPHIYGDKFFKKILLRLKYAFKILFGMRLKYSGDLIIDSGSHIDAFIEALTEGKNRLQEKLDNER